MGPLRHKEAEAAVRLAADAEDGCLWESFAAEVHGGTDLAVGVYADDRTGILAGQAAGCSTAVPVGDGTLGFIQRDRISEEDRLTGKLHADPHGERAVDVGLTGSSNTLVVQHTEHRADRRAERGEEVGPAARGQCTNMMCPDIVTISLEKAGVVVPVVLGGLVQTAGAAL